MSALPAATDFTGSGVSKGGFKTATTLMRDFLDGLLKSTGTTADARLGLGINPGVQPITASVAASALTISLNPTALDFRSATLGSGTVNNRAVAAAVSLVVPSGATLGTTNAVAHRLAVLAMDNAGAVELAVVNAAGILNLDESGLISTTVLSAGSDSINVIYSTVARSSLPYRFVGYVESTQATAGAWVTAPSLIQGVGGQALLGIIGPIQLASAVTLTTQTAVDFTSIPAGANRITVLFSGVSTNGTSVPIVQLGDAGGIESSGYTGNVSIGSFTSAWTVVATPAAGFGIATGTAAGNSFTGRLVLERINGNEWIASGEWAQTTATITTNLLQAAKTLSDTLTQIRLTTSNATDQLDAGTVNVSIG